MVRLRVALPLILAVIGGGCMPQAPAEQPAPGPAEVSMARHITSVHGVRIGADARADIIVAETNAAVQVTFSPNLLQRVNRDCLCVLGFSTAEKTFAKADYLQFLDQLHAYLMLAPPRPPPAGSTR